MATARVVQNVSKWVFRAVALDLEPCETGASVVPLRYLLKFIDRKTHR